MKIYLGADHGGYELKNELLRHLQEVGIEAVDCGAYVYDQSDDYPQIAKEVIENKIADADSVAVLICRSGQGMQMVANRYKGIRAALIWGERLAREARLDNDANTLVLPADYLSTEEAIACLDAFISTAFSNEERHLRRIKSIEEIVS